MSRTGTRRRNRATRVAIACAAGALLVLSACSSTGGAQDSSSSSSAPPSESPSPTSQAESTTAESSTTEETVTTSSEAPSEPTEPPHTVSIIANWLPQSSQGGYWQAAADDLAKDAGVTIEMKSGGPGIQTVTNVAVGDADYGMTAADNIYNARAQGIPVVGLYAALDSSPQCLVSHPEANVKTFEDLNGKNLAVAPAGAYWQIIKNKYNLKPAKETPPQSLATWAADPNMVLQCFRSEDGYPIEKNGWAANYLMISESGYNPYTQVLFTTEKRIAEHPAEVRAVVAASIEGWKRFMNGQEDDALKLMLAQNPDYTKDQATYAIKSMAGFGVDTVGKMDPARWQDTYEALRKYNVITTDMNWQDGFTLDFLPK